MNVCVFVRTMKLLNIVLNFGGCKCCLMFFYNKFATGWIVVKQKPHPMGNEYHTTAYCRSKPIFWVELVQGRDLLKEGNYVGVEFERELGSKVAALVV